MKTLQTYSKKYWFFSLPIFFFFVLSFWPKPQEKLDIICPYCDLSGADFSGKDLRNANLSHANLAGANFNGAKLKGAIFAKANLSDASFEGAIMGNSDTGPTVFSGADLLLANFNKAKLANSDFQYADITCANFSNTDISKCVFGPQLYFEVKPNCQPSFSNTIMNCDFPAYWEQLNLAGAILPDCPTRSPKKEQLKYATSIHVSATRGIDGPSCGSLSAPCSTIQYGINRCSGIGCAVLVEYGTYYPTSNIQLKTGVNLLGGYLNGLASIYQSRIIAAGGQAALTGTNLTNNAIHGFLIDGSAAKSPTEASTIIELDNCTGIQIGFCRLVGSNGADGNNGFNGTAGNDGVKGNDAHPMFGGGRVYSPDCSSGWGGFGADQGTESVSCSFPSTHCSCSPFQFKSDMGGAGATGTYAAGAPAGISVCYNCTARDKAKSPANGTNGLNGPCGTGGAHSANIAGSFSGSSWIPGEGNDGNHGGGAGGGGGGGAGGHCGYCACYCDHKDTHLGTPGGGGGSGGCGGSGGLGGQQGGASFAIVLSQSTLIILDSVAIVGGNGGKGGNGGSGAAGGIGGGGGAPYPSHNVCDKNGTGAAGSYGGTGGKGGYSGGGGGGNGGPVIDLALVGSSSFSGSSIDYYPGKTGSIGTGGKGESTCTNGDGANGLHGLVTHFHRF